MLWNLIDKKVFYRYVLAGLLIIGILMWAAIAKAPDKQNHFYFFDVGQGDSEFIRTADNYKILIDGGPDQKSSEELSKVLPFYDKKIDLIILSHNHADHLDGLISILNHYQVGEFWLSGAIHTTKGYENLLQILKDKKIKTVVKKAGDNWENNNLKINFFYPIKNMVGVMPVDQHDATLVFKLILGQNKILYTGDLNEAEEQEILDSKVDLSADILKIPHHGSATGLSPDFLAAVNPQIAIISDGKNNKYGHPAPSTLKKLGNKGIEIKRTDQSGTIGLDKNS